MSVAAEQHQAWQEARKRLDGGNNRVRAAKAITLKTVIKGRTEQVVRISPDVPLPIAATPRQRPTGRKRHGELPTSTSKLVASIIAYISRKHSVSFNSMRSAQRIPHVVQARQEAYYRLLTEGALSSPEVGKLLCRDHSTVLSGAKVYATRNGRPSL